MTYLVDTDYVVDYLKGQRKVAALLDPLLPEGLAISMITFAEVYEGIYYGHNRDYYEQGLHNLLQSVKVLGITRSVAKQFAIIRGQLRVMPHGKTLVQPKNTYDLFIAATALSYKLTLITRNISDYDRIAQLALYHPSKEAA
jgi:tRNA(fMet)-specific endonuclease VapC